MKVLIESDHQAQGTQLTMSHTQLYDQREHDHGDHVSHGHAGMHEHEPGASPWSRLTHAVSALLGGHSHDTADQVDEALEADAAGRRALLISLAGLALTAAIQAVVVILSGSVALLGDTLHNVADALTAVPLVVAFRLARRAATRATPTATAEPRTSPACFVIAMIAASSGARRLRGDRPAAPPRDVTHLWAVAAAAMVGFIGNEMVARYRIRTGRRIGSAALVADGLHARTDGFTSLAVLLGAGGVALGWRGPTQSSDCSSPPPSCSSYARRPPGRRTGSWTPSTPTWSTRPKPC